MDMAVMLIFTMPFSVFPNYIQKPLFSIIEPLSLSLLSAYISRSLSGLIKNNYCKLQGLWLTSLACLNLKMQILLYIPDEYACLPQMLGYPILFTESCFLVRFVNYFQLCVLEGVHVGTFKIPPYILSGLNQEKVLYFFYKTPIDDNKFKESGRNQFHHIQPFKLYKLLKVMVVENNHQKHPMGTEIPKQRLISHHQSIIYCSITNFILDRF